MLFELALFQSPESMLAECSLATPVAAKVLGRDVGATLIGLGFINWMARNVTGEALRALLVANVVVLALELLINGCEILVRDLPTQAPGGPHISSRSTPAQAAPGAPHAPVGLVSLSPIQGTAKFVAYERSAREVLSNLARRPIRRLRLLRREHGGGTGVLHQDSPAPKTH